ncbi:3-dehydroquinate synthase [Candidatus Levibacter sp. Uisw_134_01]|jgi:3-dehydroquinate synthase|uniref:3-dehydroquinate synthase n=1 Tax=Candidatus Levibacter sp. Uisw_134_01 TaxID=3230999 RepID=UPI003D3D2A24
MITQTNIINNEIHWQKFEVPYEFPVCFTENVFNKNNKILLDVILRKEKDKRHNVIFFIDEGITKHYEGLITELKQYINEYHKYLHLVTNPILVPGGEKIKSDLYFVEQIQESINKFNIDRHSYVVAIGGGAVLDAIGLVAATSHRGIRHIRMPTTVLSQNDSGVGVKNGVNLFGSKNYIGTFAPPFAVINDINFISKLSERDKIAGMAEAVKVALIRDKTFFNWLELNSEKLALFEKNEMSQMIRRCAELHMHQISNGGDPFEMGSARPLDFGHWSAHKLESMTNYRLRHGEAVAIGIALDARYSVLAGMLDKGLEERICCLLEYLGFKLWNVAIEKTNKDKGLELIKGLKDFQEHLGGELTITLLKNIGVGFEVHEINTSLVQESIQWLKERQR